MIDPGIQACIVCEDMPCARACATGALVVPPDGWARVHMGTLELDPERCITFQGVSCGVCARACPVGDALERRSEEHTSELQSRLHLVCRLLLEKKKKNTREIREQYTPTETT